MIKDHRPAHGVKGAKEVVSSHQDLKVIDILIKGCAVCGLPRNKKVKRIRFTDYDDMKIHYAYFCSEGCKKEFRSQLED